MRCIALQNGSIDSSVLRPYDETISIYDSAEQIREKLFRLTHDAVREELYRLVLAHFQKHPGSPWSGSPLKDLEKMISAFYASMGLKYRNEFRSTLPELMQRFYDRAVEELKKAGVRNAILGEPDAGRVKYFLNSSFEQVAMKTQKMSF